MKEFKRKYGRWLLVFVGVGIILFGGSLVLQWYARQKGTTRGLMTEEPCAPPCWRGFSPGESMGRAAVIGKLRLMPGVGHIWDREHARAPGVSIVWEWNNNLVLNIFSPPWPGLNSIYLDHNDTIEGITLSLDFELTVAELIEKYGIPEAISPVVTGTPQPSSGSMMLFYPQYGILCRVQVLPDYQLVLEPDSIVYEVAYQSPGFALDPELTRPWPDYGELDVSWP